MTSANYIVYTIVALFTIRSTLAQSVGIGTNTPHASARLQINSINQGILIPAQTAAQRSAINNPATGLLVFQTDGTAGFYYYTGAGWVNLTTGYSANNEGTAVNRHYGLTITLAGSGRPGYEDSQGEDASFHRPAGLALDAAGNVYVADQNNHTIRMITPTGLVSTYAGTGTAGSADGPRNLATFTSPTDLVLDAAGNLFVADRGNHRIRKIAANGEVTTVAGSDVGYEEGSGNIAKFDGPEGIAVDASGNIYVADQNNNRIRKIDQAGVVSTLAGMGAFGSGDGRGDLATFGSPSDVALDISGNIIVADKLSNKIRKVTPGGFVTTIAGRELSGAQDGDGATASFTVPHGVTVDLNGNIYVADRGNYKIRKITPSGQVSTLVGTGAPGANNGAGVVVTFQQPIRLAIDAFGDLYVADYDNHRIRKIILQ